MSAKKKPAGKRKASPARKTSAARSAGAAAVAGATVLVLRTCAADLTSHGGFQWPEVGPVEAPDWNPRAECGNGLHGLLWGHGGADYLAHGDAAARWLVVEVAADSVVDLGGKVKFPRGIVAYVGPREGAIELIASRSPETKANETAIVFHTASATGDAGTASATGYAGTASATGYAGTASATGYAGTASATGDAGTASATGTRGTASAGPTGILILSWWDESAIPNRKRLVVGYVGEEGIEEKKLYRLDETHRLELVPGQDEPAEVSK